MRDVRVIRRPRPLTACRHCETLAQERDNAHRMLIVVLASVGGRYEMTEAQLRALPAARLTYERVDGRLVVEVEFDPHDAELQ